MVRPIQEESNFKQMILNNPKTPNTLLTLEEIDEARGASNKVEVNSGMADLLIKLRRKLIHEGIFATDRTYNTAIKILKAEAFLNGRDSVQEDDFDILKNVLWTNPDDEKKVWSVIMDETSPEKGKILSLFEDAQEVAFATLSEKDKKKRMEKGIDTATKLKEIKKKITEHIKEMEAKKKDTKEVRKYDKQVNDLLSRVFTESCGIDTSGF
jgi:MoxR-like ATPase